MKKIFFTTLLLIGVLQFSFSQDKPILVSPEWLNQHKADKDLVILQVNYLKADYDVEHIEGARYLWPSWLAPDTPEGSMNVPDLKSATQLLRSFGISNSSHIILCHVRNEVTVTARMFLMLEHLGMKGKVSYLNGGLEAWKKQGYAITKEIPTVKPGNFTTNLMSLVVDHKYVLKHIESNSVDIVDARFKRFYDGDPVGYPRDGHIKNAKNIPYNDMVDESNTFKSTTELQSYFSPVVPDKNHEIVTYCFIGQTASVVYMAGRILGYNMKLYDGSMQEWSRIPELPMEKTTTDTGN